MNRTLQAVCHSADFRNWVKSSGCREVYVREGKIHTTFSMAQQRSGAAAQPLPVPPTSVLIGGEQVRLGNRVVVQYETEKEEKEEKKEKKASTEQTYLK
jgi:CRISPR/Cas system-associated protein Cas5 (RAMP superfamily)